MRTMRCVTGLDDPRHDEPQPIGPWFEYVNPNGVRFEAFLGANVAILRTALRLA